jgi:amino acid transporter
MIELISDVIEAVFNFAKSKLEKSYSLLKNEGFSSGFTKFLIVFISIGAVAFGIVELLALIFVFSSQIGWNWEPFSRILSNLLSGILSNLMNIFHAENIVSLMIHSFIILHLPTVLLIIVQKVITRNLIKKYRDKESDLIKP